MTEPVMQWSAVTYGSSGHSSSASDEVATLVLLQILLVVKVAKSLVLFRGRRCLDSLS
jgi:hypothetical protein